MKITVLNFKNRPSPWCVRYYENRRPRRKFFKTRDEAERYAADMRATVRLGTDLKSISPALQQIAGTGYDLFEVVRVGLSCLRTQGVSGISPNMTFSEAAAITLERAKKNGVAQNTWNDYRTVFGTHCKIFGNRVARCITEDEVGTYLNSVRTCRREGGPCAQATKKTYLETIRRVIKTAGVEKPLPGITVPLPKNDPKFFTVDQVKAIFGAAREDERGFLALAMFAGLRPCRLHEMPIDCISTAEKRIHIPRSVSKNRCAFDLFTGTASERAGWPGLPPVLWLWLDRYPFVPKRWQSLQARLSGVLDFEWVFDGCRHTAASYYKALHGAAATAELLTQFSRIIVTKHYVGYATQQQALDFFAITPDSIPAPVVPIRKKIIFPHSVAELSTLLKDKPLSKIAVEIGCSDTTLIRHCRKNGIETPKRGEWTSRALQEVYGKKS